MNSIGNHKRVKKKILIKIINKIKKITITVNSIPKYTALFLNVGEAQRSIIIKDETNFQFLRNNQKRIFSVFFLLKLLLLLSKC